MLTAQQKHTITRTYAALHSAVSKSPSRVLNTLTTGDDEAWRTCLIVDRLGWSLSQVGTWMRRHTPQVYGTSLSCLYSPSGQTFYTRGHVTITSDKFYVFLHGRRDV